jgi:hypothetical protein
MASKDTDAFATSERSVMERSFGLLSSASAKCCLQRIQTLANVDFSPILVISINAVDSDTVENFVIR